MLAVSGVRAEGDLLARADDVQGRMAAKIAELRVTTKAEADPLVLFHRHAFLHRVTLVATHAAYVNTLLRLHGLAQSTEEADRIASVMDLWRPSWLKAADDTDRMLQTMLEQGVTEAFHDQIAEAQLLVADFRALVVALPTEMAGGDAKGEPHEK